MWQPSNDKINTILKLLQDSLSSDNSVQQKVTHQLDQLSMCHEFYLYLMYIIVNYSTNLDKNQYIMSFIMLKNSIRDKYPKFNEDERNFIKNQIILLLDTKYVSVRTNVGNLISVIFSEDFNYIYEICPFLINKIENSSFDDKKSFINIIRKLCEDVEYSPKIYDSSSIIRYCVETLIKFLTKECGEIRAIVIKSIEIFVPQYPHIVLDDTLSLVNILVQLFSDTDKRVCSALANIVVSIAYSSYEAITPYTNEVFSFIFKCMTDSYDIALEATEFWACVLNSESGRNSLAQSLSILLPMLVKFMRYSEYDYHFSDYQEIDFHLADTYDEELFKLKDNCGTYDSCNSGYQTMGDTSSGIHDDRETSSDDYSWTLRKCSANALDMIAVTFGDKIIPQITCLNDMLFSQDWLDQEAAILAIGAIAEGCYKGVESFFPNIFPILLNLINHPNGLVRGIVFWTLSRYTYFYAKKWDYINRFMPMLLQNLLDRNKYCQANAISCLTTILTYYPSYKEISIFINDIGQKFVECLSCYKNKNMIALYYLIGQMAETDHVSLQVPVFVDTLIPILVHEFIKNREIQPVDLSFCQAIISLCKYMTNDMMPFSKEILEFSIQVLEQAVNQYRASQTVEDVNEPNPQYAGMFFNIIINLIQIFKNELSDIFIRRQFHATLLLFIQYKDLSLQINSTRCLCLYISYFFDTLKHDLENILQLLISLLPETSGILTCQLIDSLSLITKKSAEESKIYFNYIIQSIIQYMSSCKIDTRVAISLSELFNELKAYNVESMDFYLPYISETWCKAIRDMPNSNLRVSSAIQLIDSLSRNLEYTVTNFPYILDTLCSSNDMNPELRDVFKKLLQSIENSQHDSTWRNVVASIPSRTITHLREIYGFSFS